MSNCIIERSNIFIEKTTKAKEAGDDEAMKDAVCFLVNNLVNDCMETVGECHNDVVKDLVRRISSTGLSTIADIYEIDTELVCGGSMVGSQLSYAVVMVAVVIQFGQNWLRRM